MTDTKWTPGPWIVGWKAKGNNLPGHTSISGAIGKPQEHFAMAQVVTQLDGEKYREGEANARLISAAPDMAEALEHLLMAIDLVCEDAPYDPSPDVARARTALAKARGDE